MNLIMSSVKMMETVTIIGIVLNALDLIRDRAKELSEYLEALDNAGKEKER